MGLAVTGLKELVRDLEKTGVEVTDLKKVFGDIAAEARMLAAGFAPHKTGRLARSIRSSTAKNYATVSAGGARAPYAGPINFGWGKRNITGSGFMQKADAAIRPRVLRDLVAAVDKLLKEKNLQ